MIPAISLASAFLAGVDDDEEESERLLAPEFSKNALFLWLPKDEKGNRQKIDLSFLDPYGYWKRPITAVLQDQPWKDKAASASWEIVAPFLTWDIAAKAIGEASFNGKIDGGKVYNEADSAAGISLAIANHLRKAAQPGFANNLEKFWNASADEVNKSGKPYKHGEEVLAFFGWRVSTFDPKVALYYQAFEYQEQKLNASKLLSSVAVNLNKVSNEDLRGAYDKSMTARGEAFERMEKIVKAVKNTGMDDNQLRNILKASGVSKDDAKALVSGNAPVYSPSKTMMKLHIKKASLLFSGETEKEFKSREKHINSLRVKGNSLDQD
jgi:hypothetical protein